MAMQMPPVVRSSPKVVSSSPKTVPGVWHRVPDPDEDPHRARFLSWGHVDTGFELTGVYRGTADRQYGEYGVLDMAGGREQRFALPKLLARRLSLVDPGTKITIVYLGPRVSKTAETAYHTFDVFSTTQIALPAPGSPDEEVPF